jgi:hypothetical protein
MNRSIILATALLSTILAAGCGFKPSKAAVEACKVGTKDTCPNIDSTDEKARCQWNEKTTTCEAVEKEAKKS